MDGPGPFNNLSGTQTDCRKVQIGTNDYIIFHSIDNVITVQYIMMQKTVPCDVNTPHFVGSPHGPRLGLQSTHCLDLDLSGGPGPGIEWTMDWTSGVRPGLDRGHPVLTWTLDSVIINIGECQGAKPLVNWVSSCYLTI